MGEIKIHESTFNDPQNLHDEYVTPINKSLYICRAFWRKMTFRLFFISTYYLYIG